MVYLQRTVLELKLSEAREHLSQVKSSWSDKITHHETQIANLNSKIADDNEELLNSRREIEQLKDHYQAKVGHMCVSHRQQTLNSKIANDNEDLLNSRRKIEQLEDHYQAKVSCMCVSLL